VNLILVGKGAVLFNIAKLIFNKKKHKILKVFWDKRKNNKSDKYYLKHLRNITNVVQTNNINSKKDIYLLKKQNFTFLLSINNTQIFNNHFLEIFKNKIINYHYSLIPSYKGLYSCTKVLLREEKFSGISWHYVSKKIDNGKLVYQKKFKINKNDNAVTLISKLNNFCIKHFESFLKNVSQKKIIKNKFKVKDFKLNLKKNKYSRIAITMPYKKIDRIYRAFDYEPFESPLPRVKINIENIDREVKKLEVISKPKLYFEKFLKVKEKEYIMKTIDNKYILISLF
tara:strand:- start:48 stop:899 length:852 start_codon:yes stop_codon:yes gene_type:complete